MMQEPRRRPSFDRRLRWLAIAAALAWSGAALAGAVNINTADAKMLARELSGVGPAKAEAIVKYRQAQGPFKTPEEIRKVEGVGDAIYEANKGNIRTRD